MAHHLLHQPGVSDPLAILRRSVTRDQNNGENIHREVKRVKLEHAFRNPRFVLGNTKSSEVAHHTEEPAPQVSNLEDWSNASTGGDAKKDDTKSHVPPQQAVPLPRDGSADFGMQFLLLEQQNKKPLTNARRKGSGEFDTANEPRVTDILKYINVEVGSSRTNKRPRHRLSEDVTSKASQADTVLRESNSITLEEILSPTELYTPFRPSSADHLLHALFSNHVAYTISDDRTGGEIEERRRRLEVLQTKSLDLRQPQGKKKVEAKDILDDPSEASDTRGSIQYERVRVHPKSPDFHKPDRDFNLDSLGPEHIDVLENVD